MQTRIILFGVIASLSVLFILFFIYYKNDQVAKVEITFKNGTKISKNDHWHDKIQDKANLGFIHAFVASISVIVVSELGDKTFFIAAIMAMRHSRLIILFWCNDCSWCNDYSISSIRKYCHEI